MNYNIGKIVKTHGIKGELVVKSLTDFERFSKGSKVFVYLNNEKIVLTIKSVRNTNKGFIILFEGYQNINEVLKYQGLEVFTNEKPELDVNEFHFNDLINKEVVNQENNYLGKVVDVVSVPQGHLLRIEIDNYTKLVPFNKAFVKEVKDVIVINEIEGLL